MKNNNKGFSLVELIVVIAIMAILAAIAIPTFAHFIGKAHDASDAELLHNINYIFNAACVENGLDIKDVDSAEWNMDTMTVSNVTVNGVANEKIVESFNRHFDLKDEKFYNITSLMFHSTLHEFVDPANIGDLTLSYGGGYIYISSENLDALKGSTFGEMGMEPLLNQLDDVTNLAAGLGSHEAMQSILTSGGFVKSAAAALGIPVKDESTGEERSLTDIGNDLEAKKTELAKEALLRDGITESDPDYTTKLNNAKNKIQANAAVLYTAQVTSVMPKENVQTLMADADRDTILANMTGADSGVGLAQASLMCGMYTSYVNSSQYKGDDKTVTPEKVLAAIGTDDFQNYLDSNQGKADLDGYLASLSMINSSTQDPNAVSELMINGFNDPKLVAMLNGATK